MNNIWSFHDEKVKELKQLYDRMSKQTQNDLQKVFDTFNFSFDNLYDIADTKTKKKADTIIEEYQDKGLLKGYFGILAKNIYIRKKVKNNEILEILIYGAYIEEQSKLEEKEKQVFKEDVNYYYQEGQEEVNKTLKKKKPISVIDEALFLYLLEQPNFTGFNWKQYIDSTIKYNAEQIYKQAVIKLQQRKELDINDNEFKRIIDLQNNQKININNDKISGAVDEELIGLNNQAKVEGIKRMNENAQVRFLAVTDENSTDMCQSMKDKLFYIDKENDFYRMYGETQNTLRNEHIKVQGLVLGINLPPITHHFHWCRSSITYYDIKSYNNIPRYIKQKNIKGNQKLNELMKQIIEKMPKKVKELLKNTEYKITDKEYSYYNREKDTIYLSQSADSEEIIHEIGHVVETKLDLLHNKEYIKIQQRGINIKEFPNIGNISGYDNKYDFLLDGNKFISDYQRFIYDEDINKKPRFNDKFEFNTQTLGEYFSEAFRCYFSNKKLLKNKDKDLYKFIERNILDE